MKIYKRKLTGLILALIISFVLPVSAVSVKAGDKLIVGGIPFGVKFMSEGIVVVGFSEIETAEGAKIPAYDAGIRINDIITHVNGQNVTSSLELLTMVEESGETVELTLMREGKREVVRFKPLYGDDGKRKTGMWIRDTTAGIGTVTYIDPETCEFGGLGHGICDTQTGEILKMDRGTVVDVQISGITRGKSGSPGELKGYFSSNKSGVLLENTPCGVYGVFSKLPDCLCDRNPVDIAGRQEVKDGDAVIRCTLGDGEPCEYCIRIENINYDSRDNRSFTVVVTDDALIEKTGGIVQGMSGSPILQNGKLVGAITHVLINDPEKGYGIFIENMLDAAE